MKGVKGGKEMPFIRKRPADAIVKGMKPVKGSI